MLVRCGVQAGRPGSGDHHATLRPSLGANEARSGQPATRADTVHPLSLARQTSPTAAGLFRPARTDEFTPIHRPHPTVRRRARLSRLHPVISLEQPPVKGAVAAAFHS